MFKNELDASEEKARGFILERLWVVSVKGRCGVGKAARLKLDFVTDCKKKGNIYCLATHLIGLLHPIYKASGWKKYCAMKDPRREDCCNFGHS